MSKKRAANTSEWDLYEDVIRDLYETQRTPLTKVMNTMKEQHGFNRSKPQYERVFKKWGIKKNLTSKDWKDIAPHVKARDLQKRQSAVWFHGTLVGNDRIRREVARHGFQSTVERMQPSLSFQSIPTLPTYIRVSTPPMLSTFSPAITTFQIGPSHQTGMSFDLSTSHEYIIECSEMTPWHKFMVFIDAHKGNNILSLPLPWDNASSEHLIQDQETNINGYSHEVTTNTPQNERLQAEDWLYKLLIADIVVDGINWHYVDPQCLNPNQYLPKTRNNAQDLDMNAVCDLSHQNNQLEFLKLAVKLLSDNAYVPELKSAIVELAQDNRVLSALRRLLDRGLLSVEAFAEKLLIPAIEAGNKTLVEMLIDAGVSCDMEGRPSLALLCAIGLGQTELVEVLLNHGANASVDLGCSYEDYNLNWIRNQCRECESFLDIAVALGKVDIVMAIITPNPCRQATPPTTLHTLFHAASLSMPDVLLRLLSADPAAVELMKLNPYIMISGAARGGSVAVFTELRKHGLDFDATMPIKGTPDLGKITALAEASYRGHKQLVEYLLSEGANAEGRVHSLYTLPPLFAALWFSQRGITLSGRILPSHWLVDSEHHCLLDYNPNKNRDVVRLLLDHDANPSTSWGGYYAIHIAAAHHNGNSSHDTAITTTNITALQKAGADINISNEYDDRQSIDFALPFGSTGSTEIVHTLLRMGATLDHKDALKSAFLTRNRELVDMVLEKIPRGSGDSSSLEACIIFFGCELARDLLKKFTFDQAKNLNSPGIICAAVVEGDEEFVRMCCEIERPSHDYMTLALALAAQLHNVAMIQLLIEVGAKPYMPLTLRVKLHAHLKLNPHLSRGTDALNELFAIRRKDSDDHDCEHFMQAAKLLIHACEGELDHVDEEKMRRSSLRRFFRNSVQSAPLAIVRMLVDSGFSIYESYDSLQPPLQWALESKRRSTAVFLLEHGSNPDWSATVVVEDFGYHRPIHTALQYAVQQNWTSMTKSLLDKKVDVNAEPAKFRGATAFQYCAINSNFEIASMLLQANADINAPPALCKGRTAIEGAAEHGRLNMVKFLLVAGADIRGRNNKNYARTIYRAWANGHSTILKMIQEFKRDRFGPDDVESIKVIVQSMTQDHLNFWDLAEEATWPEIFAEGRMHRYEIVQEWVD